MLLLEAFNEPFKNYMGSAITQKKKMISFKSKNHDQQFKVDLYAILISILL